jgi:ubiquinone/menaquinone biosynthesis C-methylase UbiE
MLRKPPPHYARDYARLVDALKAGFPLDTAMSNAVGGHFDAIGRIERSIVEHFGLRPGMSLLDFGCGSGRLSVALSDLEIDYLGIDVVDDLLAYARRRSNPAFVFQRHTALSIPRPSDSLDMACAFSVFTHLQHHETYVYLADIRRALKPGGVCVLSYLSFANPQHWPTFLDAVAAGKGHGPSPLVQFIEPSVIALWARELALEHVATVDATAAPWGGGRLGQNVAVLRKPS